MARNTFTKAEVMILLNGTGANNTLEELRKRSESLTKQLEEMGDVSALDDAQLKKWEDLQRQLTVVDSGIKKLGNSMKSTSDIINDLSGSSLKQLRAAAKDLRTQISDLSEEEMDKLPKLMTDLASVENQITKIDNRIEDTKRTLAGVPKKVDDITVKYNDQSKSIKTVVAELGKYMLSVFGLQEALGKASEAFDKNIALSDRLADVRKATGLTKDEVNALSTALQGLDTRTTLEGLNELAYAGGRMGIQGADNLYGFVKAADQLNVALAEDLGEGAIETLTKMADVTGLIGEMGYEKALLSLGSAINTLTSTSVAEGDAMVDMLSRLAGVGVSAKISTDELLALSAASDAAGLSAETASTALSQFIVKLKTDTETVANAAGISADGLKALLDEGRTMDAIVATFEGLSSKGGLESLAPVMKDLGGSGSRAITVISTLVNNVDNLKQMLDTSKGSFAAATSVTDEYNVKNENAAALLQRMKNALTETFVNSKMVERIEGFLRTLMELPKVVEKNKTTIIAALIAITAALTRVEFKVKAMFRLGISKSLAVLGKRILALGGPIKSLFALLAANPWTAAIAAISIFATVVYDAYKKVDYFGKAQKRLNDLEGEFSSSVGVETAKLRQLVDWMKRAEKGSDEYNKAKNAIQTNFGGYLKSLNIELDKLEDIETAYLKVKEAIEATAKARMAEKGINEAVEAYGENTGGQYERIYKRLRKEGGRSEEEISDIVSRIRTSVDTGDVIPQDIGIMLHEMGNRNSEVIWNAIIKIRKAKKAYEQEIQTVKERYGDVFTSPVAGNINEDVSTDDTTTTTTTTTTTVETPEDKKKKALQAAKQDQQAALDALEIFYKQQEQVINESYINREITATERERRIAEIETRLLQSRIAARRALLGEEGAAEEWQAELSRMDAGNVAATEENTATLATLYGKNLTDIGEALRNFGEGEMDGIRKNMEQDRLTIQTNAVQMRQEIEQILLENDFTGKVTQQYMAAMQKLNLFFPEMEEDMKASAEWLMQGLHEIYPKIFDVDILTEDGLNAFRNMVLNAKGASVEMATQGADAMRLLYYQILEYGDAMAEAERKARKAGQRVADQRWRQSGGNARVGEYDAELDAIKNTTSLFSRVGLASENVATDMEIEIYKKRMDEALKYRDLVIQCGGDIENANKKVQESIAELSSALVEKTMTQLETLKSFMDPLETLGEEMGAAFAIEDATKRTEAFSEAMWNAADEIADATKDMITNWVKQKIQHAINKKAIEAQEATSQAAMKAIVQAGEQAKATAVQQSETQISATKQAHSAQNISTQATETGADAALGIAQGSAKTIGELGWMGIPLVAVIQALIGGLLSWAMGKVKGAGKAVTQTAAPTGKVVSSMLAYDSGNVQQVLAGGRVYSARVGGIDGSGLVTRPTLTNVGGQPALVGELGPELVIGRATTRAMMQDNPRLLSSLIQFDRLHSGRGFRAYDNGNVQSMDGGDGKDDKDMKMMMTNIHKTLVRLNEQLDRGIEANIGRKKLTAEVIDGLYQEKVNGNNKNLKRLLRTD